MMKRLFYILFSAMAIVAASCSDDSFTTSRSQLLTFSTDTLKFDTLFSGVPSATSSFMVYNRGDKALRIRQARLEHGNQTGFRVNVDGVFLDNANGSQAQDFEIRKGDSIRVFVELTSFPTTTDSPQLVADNLVFALESGVEQKVNLTAYSWDALSLTNLRVGRDTLITSVKPIVVYGGIRVDSGAVLTIKSPAQLYFHDSAGIDVYGTLVVEGEKGNDVVMRGDRLDRMFDYLPYDRVSGQWKGIRLHSSSTANRLSYADIHSTDDAILCDSSAFDPGSHRLVVANSTIHNCKGYGIKAVNANISLVNCQLTNTLADCLAVEGGATAVTYCTVGQFYPFSADRGVAIRFGSLPLTGLRGSLTCINSVFTGYADDVVMGDSTLFDYQFFNSVLRTPSVADSVLLASRFHNVVFELPSDSIQGDRHFVSIDIDRQYYDFHLDSLSTLRGKALPLEAIIDDREGLPRGDTPDIGCFKSR